MAPKGLRRMCTEWLLGCPERIEDSGLGGGSLEELLPFYNMGPMPFEAGSSSSSSAPPGVRARPASAPAVPPALAGPYAPPSCDPARLRAMSEKAADGPASPSPFRERSRCPYVGLRNIGSTCYLNSVVQYLFVNLSFRRHILEAEAEGDEILRSLQLLFGRLQDGCESVCDPAGFVDSSGLSRGEQEDVTELWQLLIGYLAVRTKGAIPSLVSFQQTTRVTCEGCGGISERHEVLCELRVSLQRPGATTISRRPSDLEAELAEGFEVEKLSGENQYACEKCGCLQNANRCNALRSLPRLLHIVLDRFFWDAASGERRKICKEVSYPERLDLSAFVGADAPASQPGEGGGGGSAYRLIGVLEHHSQTAESGHYTATLRESSEPSAPAGPAAQRGQWWLFNDSRVSECAAPGREVAGGDAGLVRWSSASAYMLAYERVEARPPAGADGASRAATGDAGGGSRIQLPKWVEESVRAGNAEIEGKAKELHESFGRQSALLLARAEEVDALPRRLAEAWRSAATPPAEEAAAPDRAALAGRVAVVPEAWLDAWLAGVESEPPGEGATRVDYSGILLPSRGARPAALQGGKPAACQEPAPEPDDDAESAAPPPPPPRPRLDPFAAFDGRARAMPLEVLKDLFGSGRREVKVLPGELGGEEGVLLSSLACPDAAHAVRGLMRCYRDLARYAVKVRDSDVTDEGGGVPASRAGGGVIVVGDDDPEAESFGGDSDSDMGVGVVLVRSSTVKQFIARYLSHIEMPKPPAPGHRRRPAAAASASSILYQLGLERRRCRHTPTFSLPAFADVCAAAAASGGSSSSTAPAGAAQGTPEAPGFDFGAGLRCPHGLRAPSLKAQQALLQDVRRLEELGDEARQLWARLGFEVPPMMSSGDLLGAGVSPCTRCSEQAKADRQSKRARTMASKASSTKLAAEQSRLQRLYPVLLGDELPLQEVDIGRLRAGASPRACLVDGRYALIPTRWLSVWRRYITAGEAAPGPLDASPLTCRHGLLRHNPAAFFEMTRETTLQATQHPDSDFYVLAPYREAQQIFTAFPPPRARGASAAAAGDGVPARRSLSSTDTATGISSGSGWRCWMVCKTVRLADGHCVQTYDVHPRACKDCVAAVAAGGIELHVRLKDERASADESPASIRLRVFASGTTTGLGVKELIASQPDLPGVSAGQLLLSVEGTQFGDAELLKEVLGNKGPVGRASVTGEILDFDLSEPVVPARAADEPPAKRQRTSDGSSSLLRSNLALGASLPSVALEG